MFYPGGPQLAQPPAAKYFSIDVECVATGTGACSYCQTAGGASCRPGSACICRRSCIDGAGMLCNAATLSAVHAYCHATFAAATPLSFPVATWWHVQVPSLPMAPRSSHRRLIGQTLPANSSVATPAAAALQITTRGQWPRSPWLTSTSACWPTCMSSPSSPWCPTSPPSLVRAGACAESTVAVRSGLLQKWACDQQRGRWVALIVRPRTPRPPRRPDP